MFVLGTAGHVDHGKSALVHALTGIDPDRLHEEKERGMTIDLGFAWLKLPSGREVSIIDVPGHEKFIKNMLAGVGGIDLALLVIAADEGVMPQTREHLAILDLLGIDRGIVAITKKDLVDEELLGLVSLETREEIKGTVLAEAPILTVSALTGEGLPGLVSAIDHLLEYVPTRRDVGRPRLPIDRAFTVKGFGTVVTGTLSDGQLSVGQEVEILPPLFRTRIRGLQTHKQKIDTALPGTRVAANLASIDTDELERGYVVTNPGWLVATRTVDVKLQLLPYVAQPLTHNATVTFYTGASEMMAKVRLLEGRKLEPGQSAWAQIELRKPIALVRKDRFIIRSAGATIGGGEIIDPYAKRHRRPFPGLIETLTASASDDVQEVILTTLRAQKSLELEKLAARCNLPENVVSQFIEQEAKTESEKARIIVVGKGSGSLVISDEGWEHLVGETKHVVQRYHEQFPFRRGMPKEELRNKLDMPEQAFIGLSQRLRKEGILIEDGSSIRLPGHEIRPTKEQEVAMGNILKSLEQNPYSPPGIIAGETKQSTDTELLNFLIEQGKVVKVSDNIIFAASAYEEMVARVIDHIKSHGSITVAEVRDLFGTSRKYALALMEHLDAQKITRRIGDERVLR